MSPRPDDTSQSAAGEWAESMRMLAARRAVLSQLAVHALPTLRNELLESCRNADRDGVCTLATGGRFARYRQGVAKELHDLLTTAATLDDSAYATRRLLETLAWKHRVPVNDLAAELVACWEMLWRGQHAYPDLAHPPPLAKQLCRNYAKLISDELGTPERELRSLLAQALRDQGSLGGDIKPQQVRNFHALLAYSTEVAQRRSLTRAEICSEEHFKAIAERIRPGDKNTPHDVEYIFEHFWNFSEYCIGVAHPFRRPGIPTARRDPGEGDDAEAAVAADESEALIRVGAVGDLADERLNEICACAHKELSLTDQAILAWILAEMARHDRLILDVVSFATRRRYDWLATFPRAATTKDMFAERLGQSSKEFAANVNRMRTWFATAVLQRQNRRRSPTVSMES